MNQEFIKEVEKYLEEYHNKADQNLNASSSKKTYKYHSKKFVEFIKGKFIPGETLK